MINLLFPRVAVSVGDGAVRILESGTLHDDEKRLTRTRTALYWQNVQGKVLTAAWHPTKENLLAFGTGESRVSTYYSIDHLVLFLL